MPLEDLVDNTYLLSVSQDHKNNDEKNFVYQLDANGLRPIWEGSHTTLIRKDESTIPIHERPAVGIHANGRTYIGSTWGIVYDLEQRTKRARFPEPNLDLRTDDTPREDFYKLDFFIRGGRAITGIVEVDGKRYDSSPNGLYEEGRDTPIIPNWIMTLRKVNNKLAFIPTPRVLHGDTESKKEGPNYETGALTTLDGDILFYNAIPFDGSGCGPGRMHILNAGTHLHIAHGDYPGYKRTIKERYPPHETRSWLAESSEFGDTEGTLDPKVYDIREVPEKSIIIESNTSDTSKGEVFEGASSLSRGGSLLTTQRIVGKGMTQIVDVKTREVLAQISGRADFLHNAV